MTHTTNKPLSNSKLHSVPTINNKGYININLKNISLTLEFLKLNTPDVEKYLITLSSLSKSHIIHFDMLERGLRKILMKKGETKKNIQEYFKKVIKSLKYRDDSEYLSEPEPIDYELEKGETSIIPGKVYRKELYYLQVELLKLQEHLKKTGKTVIILFEGRDSAGKGSTIKKFVENLNPRYYNVIALGVPTKEERKDWWGRYKSQIKPGMINLFDRSWYNRGLIEPVMGYGTQEEYLDFMENVESFENDLVKTGNYLFKLWFSIDKSTQAKRFELRKSSPLKYWKYSPNDSKMQDLWDRFTIFKERLFDKTSTKNHPWVIIDAEDKRVSGLNSIRYVLKNVKYKGKNKKIVNIEYPEAITVLRP